MQVKELMTQQPTYISKQTPLREAAQKMAKLDCGFLPVGDNDRLDGVITDRDIVLRAVANGVDMQQTTAGDILTDRVLYCFEDDRIEDAAHSMQEQQVYRLVVLNNAEEKRLRGIITLGDVARQGTEDDLVGETAECVAAAA